MGGCITDNAAATVLAQISLWNCALISTGYFTQSMIMGLKGYPESVFPPDFWVSFSEFVCSGHFHFSSSLKVLHWLRFSLTVSRVIQRRSPKCSGAQKTSVWWDCFPRNITESPMETGESSPGLPLTKVLLSSWNLCFKAQAIQL